MYGRKLYGKMVERIEREGECVKERGGRVVVVKREGERREGGPLPTPLPASPTHTPTHTTPLLFPSLTTTLPHQVGTTARESD